MSNIFRIINDYWYRAPVDVVSIIRDAGIDYREDFLGDDVSGMIERVGPDHYAITVNLADGLPRRRFTAAHELAHYIYHRDLIGSGLMDNRAYRCAPTGKFRNENIKPHHETEANQFAANLLMPAHLIRMLENQGITDTAEQARRLGVSVPAMRIRKEKPLVRTSFEQDEARAD